VKLLSLLPSVAAASVLAAAMLSAAQAPQMQTASPPGASAQAEPPGGRPMRSFPPPTNLKVLPKDTTGAEVRDMMETWAGALGVQCDNCHMPDPNRPARNGRPRLNFADDSKTDKQVARIMYTMTQQINKDYISKTMDMDKEDEGSPVTCGTCHRGHKMPETFVIPPEEPRGGPAFGAAPPPDASATPQSN